MKALYLLRHAAALAGSGNDHDRALAAPGIVACGALGRHFAGAAIQPDVVLCSTAKRARETIERTAAAAGWSAGNPPIDSAERLYAATSGQLLAMIRETGDACGSLMLVGHNPGTEEIARILVGGGEPAPLTAFAGKYAAGALATILFDVASWSEVGPGMGRLSAFVTPRALTLP